MVTPSRELAGARPVDHLKGDPAPLLHALKAFHLAVDSPLDGAGGVRSVGSWDSFMTTRTWQPLR
jgi:hypothetical protein